MVIRMKEEIDNLKEFALCAKCGKRVKSPIEKFYCNKCELYYCDKHFKKGPRIRVAAGTDADVPSIICPKDHTKLLYFE